MNRRHFLPWSFLTLLGISFFSLAQAGTVTNTAKNTATVANSCVINSTQSIALGAYIPSSGASLQGSGSISLTCTKGDAVSVLLDSGGNALSGNGSSLNYALYTDSGFSQIFGKGASYTTANLSNLVYYNAGPYPVSLAQCAALANNTIYSYYTPSSRCFYGYSPSSTSTNYGTDGLATGSGLVVGNTTVTSTTNYMTIYLPAGSVNTGGTNYTFAIQNTGSPLTGASSSVKNPIVLTYYAKVPASQDVPPGTYLDTVTLQVNF